jgi:hypothetical protein
VVKKLRIFVASPGDVAEERQIVTIVVDELRRIMGAIRGVELEAVKWETHAWPDVGSDAQAVINREIGEFDIFVGVMWRRFGTPTGRADSGTGEEFERAYSLYKRSGRPKILFYFRTTPFYSTDVRELAQFRKVIGFRSKLDRAGVLFRQYETPLEFERYVREHLIRQVLELTVRQRARRMPAAGRPPSPGTALIKAASGRQIFMSAAREDSWRLRPLYRMLVGSGLTPWLDVLDLLPGSDWQTEISRAIAAADVFLFFVSEASVSKRGYINKELASALELVRAGPAGVPYIIPVRLDSVLPPPALHEYQWVDLFEPTGIEKLMTAIRHATARRNAKRPKRGPHAA